MLIDEETEKKNAICPFWVLIEANILNSNYPKKLLGENLHLFLYPLKLSVLPCL